MLRAVLLVSRWIAAAHDRWRTEIARRRPLSARIDELEERVRRLQQENELLRARLHRLPHRHRPRYRPRSPGNRLPDLFADLVHRLKREWPRWGTRRIAGIPARLGIRASRTTVQRMLRRHRRPARAVGTVGPRHGSLVAKRPNHIWIVDFTRVGGLFRSIWVGAVIDAFSRRVLSIGVAARGPSSLLVLRLLRQAIHNFGSPTWLISDHGPEMTSNLVGRFLETPDPPPPRGHRQNGVPGAHRDWLY